MILSSLGALLAALRRPVGIGRGKDAVVDRTGLANETSPLQLRFRNKSDDVAHVLSCSRLVGNASPSRCELYAKQLNRGFRPPPGEPGERATPVAACGFGADRTKIESMLEDHELVMEATSGLEPE
ncbi:hypothetical protein GWG65_26585 [Bradyrhizobium sp. CSA207]|nr:hypothetical protein [Bradyrhizobium sp. CSA207]